MTLPQPPTIEDAVEWISRAISYLDEARADGRFDAATLEALRVALIEKAAQNIVCGKRPPWPREPL